MGHSHNHSHASAGGKRLGWTLFLNIIITAAEFIGGIMSGYLALIADAFHNLSDVAALILAYFGEKSSQKPATKKSTYGYKRIEVMTAFISAVSLVVIAIYIFYEAYQRFILPIDLSNPELILIIATIGLIGNVLSVVLLHSSKDKTLNFKAAFLHMLYDAISSVAVIIGAIVIIYTGWTALDPILAVIIGLMILWSSYGVIKEAAVIFLEGVPSQVDYDKVAKEISSHPKVNALHDLHIWSLSSHDIALSCHICISPQDYGDSPEIMRELTETLDRDYKIGHATFQPEAGECPNENIGWFNQHGGGGL